MKRLEFIVAEKSYKYEAPENWDEVTTEQFLTWVSLNGKVSIELVHDILRMDDVVAVSLTPAEWWMLVKEFDWMADRDGIRKLYIDKLQTKNGQTWYGYNPDFSDVSWEEWTFADTYASAGRWDVVTAVLYRQEKKNWDNESDRRIPFTKYGTEARIEQTSQIDKITLMAIQVNYLLLRKHLTDHYVHLFFEQPEEEQKTHGRNRKKPKQHTDWLRLIRNMMGDNFYEENKYLQLPVPSVLFQLENRVKEAKKNAKLKQ